MIFKSDEGKREQVHLEQSISIPSDIHAYCLAIEFMRDWFLSKFDKDYFKTTYVNGRNVLDDFRRFNREAIIKLEKPALSITPNINHEYDRDSIDLDLGGTDVFIRRSSIYDDAFFQDRDNNIFLGIRLKQIEMDFSFMIRVNTKAEQIDLANYIKKKCRVKATQYKYLNLDYHIPLNIILSIAKQRGFEIVDGNIVDIVGFLSYLNSNSFLPIVYKYRSINGRSEFFLKTFDNYTWISCLDDLELDGGNMVGQIWTNFHVTLNAKLRIPAPDVYYYYSKDAINTTYEKVTSTMEALYTYKTIIPPDKNDKGWEQYLSTEWEDVNHDMTVIPFEELITGGRLMDVIKHTLSIGVSPSVFFDVEMYNTFEHIPYTINWDTFELEINRTVEGDITQITIYIDKEYMNMMLLNIDGKERISEKDTGTV